MVGAKLHIPVVHLEAGLRSRDRGMPEEINRLATDAISDVLWAPSADAVDNLRAEGVPDDRVSFVGNIMIDSFVMMKSVIDADRTRAGLGLEPGGYGVVTLHRPANVDEPGPLGELVDAIIGASRLLPLVFAVHPRTAAKLAQFRTRCAASRGSRCDPSRTARLRPVHESRQRREGGDHGFRRRAGRATYLGIPCITLRDSAERPITVTEGTNRLARRAELPALIAAVDEGRWAGTKPRYWDGDTASRCVHDLQRRFGSGRGG